MLTCVTAVGSPDTALHGMKNCQYLQVGEEIGEGCLTHPPLSLRAGKGKHKKVFPAEGGTRRAEKESEGGTKDNTVGASHGITMRMEREQGTQVCVWVHTGCPSRPL